MYSGYTMQNITTLIWVYQPHRALSVCYYTHRGYGAALSQSHSHLHTHTHSLSILFSTMLYVCPRCIYTHTSFGLFTIVASATYRYYHWYDNNSRTIKQPTHCFQLYGCRLSEQSDLPLVIDCRQLLDSRIILPLEGHFPNN